MPEPAAGKAPAFQLYPKDFVTDEAVKLMSLEQVGAYVLLLCHSWLNEGIPDSMEQMARLLGISEKRMSSLWCGVGCCFQPSDAPGRLINPRQERGRADRQAFVAERSESGKRGASKRWGSHKPSHGSANGSAMREPIANDSSPSPSASASASPTENDPSQQRARAPVRNALVTDRPALEREVLGLVDQVAKLTGEDGSEVMGRVGTWRGRRQVNPANMGDDRLLHVKLDLQRELRKLRGEPEQPAVSPESHRLVGGIAEWNRQQEERERREAVATPVLPGGDR